MLYGERQGGHFKLELRLEKVSKLNSLKIFICVMTHVCMIKIIIKNGPRVSAMQRSSRLSDTEPVCFDELKSVLR